MNLRPPAAIVTALLLMTTGCGSATSSSAPTALPAPTVTVTATTTSTVTETATPDPASDTEVLKPSSLTNFRDQLEFSGLPCDDWTVTIKNFSGSCDDLTVLTYSSSSKTDKLYQASLYLAWETIHDAKRSDIALLVGQNCFVRVATQDAHTLQDTMGGIILTAGA